MELPTPAGRQTTMKNYLVPILIGVAVLVAGCGSRGDVAPQVSGGTPQPASGGTQQPHPTAAPWPAYDVDDYTYTLRTMCFCADGGTPVIVTVRDGEATDAVYAHRGRGHDAGDPAGDWMRVTINDVIDAANTEHAYQVRVAWPEGQDYPTSVYVDRDANTADEEIGYRIRDVIPA
jgi:hypothetical protein